QAARKKGLSADEKRARILDLFYEKKEFFQMKELEKIAPKEKGVISQSVKEVTQLLVDEGFVECEKIGTFVCYWAFSTKASQMRQKRLDDLVNKIEDIEKKMVESSDLIKEEGKGKENNIEREKIKTELSNVKQVEEKLRGEIKSLQRYDPESMKECRKRSAKLVEDANRWTDNVFASLKWCKKKFNMDEKVLGKQFEIPEDLDYVV
ncbi:hypothetical protein PFISCL1PPCAC_20045, partial [Pristionchus fissidentatus]